jgi:hypothetical protein
MVGEAVGAGALLWLPRHDERDTVERLIRDAGVLIVPSSMRNDAYARIARALAWYHALYPEGVPPYFVSYLSDPPDEPP